MEKSSAAFMVVRELLSEQNYEDWSVQVRTYLVGHDLWDTVESAVDDHIENGTNQYHHWRQKNALALHAIQISCGFEAFSVIKEVSLAAAAWAALADKYGPRLGDSNASCSGIENLINAVDEETKEPNEVEEKENSAKNGGSRLLKTDPGNASQKINTKDGATQLYQRLFSAVSHGDWETANSFLDQYPDAVRATTPATGKTALHIAVVEGHSHIVEKLVERMTEEDLEMRQSNGFTALAAAIEVGNMSMVECLTRKNKKLVRMVDTTCGLPVVQAVLADQLRMACYLYSVTPLEDLTSLDGGKHGSDLITQCIFANHFDMAFHLLERAPHLALTEYEPQTTPLYGLSYAKVFPGRCSLRFWQKWIYDCIRAPDCGTTNHIFLDVQTLESSQKDKKGIPVKSSGLFLRCWEGFLALLLWMVSNFLEIFDFKTIYKMKRVHVQSLELLSRVCKVIESVSDGTQLRNAGLHYDIIRAAGEGNVEFITSVLKACSELMWEPAIASKMFEVAIERRQAKSFSLIYGLDEIDKQVLPKYFDENRCNLLHKAASVAPLRLLNLIPGAALQMQRELQWFKEVESLSSYVSRDMINRDLLKPRDLFTENHKDLVIAGEKWMKDTSSSCTVVGALIVTMTFAAAFTFPGGNDQNTGLPMFIDRKLFKVFMISDAIALFTSTTSVLMFLGILTSRYGEEDFLKSLPKKLIIGLSSLFLSIASMIIAFCVGLSLMFDKELWIIVPSVCFASVPVALFVGMQFPLLVDIFMSTYGPSIFDRNVKRWL